jgi:hypothetical protein
MTIFSEFDIKHCVWKLTVVSFCREINRACLCIFCEIQEGNYKCDNFQRRDMMKKLTIRKFIFNSVNVNSGEVLKSNDANAVCEIVMSFLQRSFCFWVGQDEKGAMPSSGSSGNVSHYDSRLAFQSHLNYQVTPGERKWIGMRVHANPRNCLRKSQNKMDTLRFSHYTSKCMR